MIDVTSIDARPGEAEIVNLMASYVAARLFTPRQRKSLSVIIDLTCQPVRVPVTRPMLAPQKSGLGTRPPKQFEMTVSTAAGIRDAAEVVAHELLHISQAVNGRLLIMGKSRKINGIKRVVDTARWMGGKPVTVDELAWQYRPWEIEACHWQGILVTEFLMLTTGQHAEQPVQAPKRKQLALYPVKVPAPVMTTRSQGPAFAPGPAPEVAPETTPESVTAQEPVSMDPMAQSEDAAGTSVIGSNGASIDAVIATAMPQTLESPGDSLQTGPVMADATHEEPEAGPSSLPQIEEPDEALMADLAADLAVGAQPGGSFGDPEQGAQPASNPDAAAYAEPSSYPEHEGALQNMPVYDKANVMNGGHGEVTIEVEVPGLDSPRALDPVAMSRKLDELRERGLVGA